MHRHQRIIAFFCVVTLFLSACNSKPDHRRYIPKDAALVAGVNLSALGKKIAWNLITGSKLFKEMEKKVPQKNGSDVMAGIDKAGIDAMNTFYVYLKTDKRFSTGMKVTALVPLSDATAWEAYVKKNFTQAEIKDHNSIKTTSLGGDTYVGWNKNLLIVMNAFSGSDESGTTVSPDMAAEMDNAFSINDENSIKSNKNFEKLEGNGHDITLWINYDQIMSQYMNENMASRMGGVTLSRSLWKETAIACGFDFKKGKISADMTYYASKNLTELYKELGSTNSSKDMVDRLPGKDLDMMFAMHLSTKGMRAMMDSTGILGNANAVLAEQGMNVDNILDAFTGDMAFTLNGLTIKDQPIANIPAETERSYDMSYVLKINKKENFQRLLEIAKQAGLKPNGEGYIMPLNAHDNLYVVVNDQYAVFSNKYENATAILSGNNKEKLAATISAQASGHPMAMFFDINQTLKNIDLRNSMRSPGDSAMYEESKRLLTNISFNGGEYKDDAMHAHLDVNFTNTEENSIITLLDFGMKLNDAKSKAEKNASNQQVAPETAPAEKKDPA